MRSLEEVAQSQLRQKRWARRIYGALWKFEMRYDAEMLRSLKPGPILFAGNHRTWLNIPLDMWINFPALDEETFGRLAPIRFVGTASFGHTRLLKRIQYLIRRIYEHHRVITLPNRDRTSSSITLEEKLEPIKKALECGATVVLYAEGHARLIGEKELVRPFRRGAVYLHRTTGAPIVPFALGWRKERRALRKTCVCSFGRPMHLDPQLTDNEATELLQKEVIRMLEEAGAS